jgi:enoyl-CoA hydratase/3-hydroxyacyl-CoA dehydrogenase
LATNTSTIDVTLVGALVPNDRHRIVGLHFFSPAHIMPLLEIIRTKETSPLTVRIALDLGKRIGKTSVVVGNCTGFVANRIFFPYGMAASLLTDVGTDPYAIDAALEAWGMPMGVFRMSDQVGLDVSVHVGANITQAYPERVYRSTLFPKLLDAKRLGQKSGAGVYRYAGNKPVPDPALGAFLQAAASDSKLSAAPRPFGDKELVEILLYPVVNESFRVLDEGHVLREGDIDITAIMGYGFPAHRGGIMHWARQEGLFYVATRLRYYANYFAAQKPELAGFFQPCARLLAEAKA